MNLKDQEKFCFSFTKKCLKSQTQFSLFPVEPVTHNHQLRERLTIYCQLC